MNKSKRRIVALSTAFAMAFVMVASMVLGFTSKADDTLNTLAFTFTPPTTGTSYDSIAACQAAMKDCVTVTSQGAKFDMGVLCKENGNNVNYPTEALDADTDYYAYIQFQAASGMIFDINDTLVSCSGADIVDKSIVPGNKFYGIRVKFKTSAATTTLTKASVNVTAPAVDSTMTDTTKPNITLPDGANYTVGNMRYMTKDAVNELIIPSTNKAASASTTVKEDDVYYVQFYLYPKAGYAFDVDDTTHAPNFKPTVNGDAEYYGAGYSSGDSVQFFVKVTVPKSAAPDDPADPSVTPTDTPTVTPTNTATTETTTAAAATPTTETATATAKTAPKTGDAMPIVAITFVIVGASAIGVVVYRRRRS